MVKSKIFWRLRRIETSFSGFKLNKDIKVISGISTQPIIWITHKPNMSFPSSWTNTHRPLHLHFLLLPHFPLTISHFTSPLLPPFLLQSPVTQGAAAPALALIMSIIIKQLLFSPSHLLPLPFLRFSGVGGFFSDGKRRREVSEDIPLVIQAYTPSQPYFSFLLCYSARPATLVADFRPLSGDG